MMSCTIGYMDISHIRSTKVINIPAEFRLYNKAQKRIRVAAETFPTEIIAKIHENASFIQQNCSFKI